MIEHGNYLKTKIIRLSDDGTDLLLCKGAFPGKLLHAIVAKRTPEFQNHMRVFQSTAKTDESTDLPKLRFGKYTKMNHSVRNQGAILNLTAVGFCRNRIIDVDRLEAIDQHHKSAEKAFFILTANANAVGTHVDAVFRAFERNCFGIADLKNIFLTRTNAKFRASKGKVMPELLEDILIQARVRTCADIFWKNEAPFPFQ
jgi:hypothetical protein